MLVGMKTLYNKRVFLGARPDLRSSESKIWHGAQDLDEYLSPPLYEYRSYDYNG